jgi:hydroxysqualene dehydroxylase
MDHHVITRVPRVAVIGAGYSGIAAAVSLAEHGVAATVFESARILGGRARKIEYQEMTLDNGQHILSGAYTELLRMMALVGVARGAVRRVPLTLQIAPNFSLRAWPLPAPLHLAAGLMMARGLSLSARMEASRLMQTLKQSGFRVDASRTVAHMLYAAQQGEEICRLLWQPLTVSALNTPIETASAQVLANVLRDTLAARREASDLILPQTDLSALFPEPAADWLEQHGSTIQTGMRIQEVARIANGFRVTAGDNNSGSSGQDFESVIIAVGPHQLDRIRLPAALAKPLSFPYEPIYTVYLKYPQRVPLKRAMLGRVDGMAQWFFDREALSAHDGVVAAVISASGAHEALDQVALARRVHDELVATVGPLPLPTWQKVVAEKFATFACTPAAHAARPATLTAVPGCYLAGDYVACDYPATLEAAVRNGVAAATAARTYLSQHNQHHQPERAQRT